MNLIFDEVAHTYTDKNGKIIPSVTQILGQVYGTGLEDAPSYFVERAAQKGSSIHKEIEAFLKEGKDGTSKEFQVWKKWWTPGGAFECEKVICADTPHGRFAGTLDLYKGGWIYDWKTCKTATHKQIKKWQMQLSFYAYAMRQYGFPVNEPLRVIQLKEDNYHHIHVDYLGDEFVEGTMALYKEGSKAQEEHKELQTVSNNDLKVLEDVLVQIDGLQKVVDSYREKIKEEMERRGILDINFGGIKISYVAPHKCKKFDSTSFKKEHEDLFKQYQKETNVKGFVRIETNG